MCSTPSTHPQKSSSSSSLNTNRDNVLWNNTTYTGLSCMFEISFSRNSETNYDTVFCMMLYCTIMFKIPLSYSPDTNHDSIFYNATYIESISPHWSWHIYSGSRDTNNDSWLWVCKLHWTTTLEVSFSGSSNPNYHFLIVMCFTTGQQIVSEEELLIQLAIQQSLADSEMSSRRPQESWAQETALSNSEEDLQR